MNLSLIIPAYNSATVIRGTLNTLLAYLPSHFSAFEIIVVDDASLDSTSQEVLSFQNPHLKLLRHQSNQGKYGAIKTGMLAASGTCRLFTDADLPYAVSAIPYFAHLVNDYLYHLAIGDRTLPDSIDHTQTGLMRRLFSGSCRTAVRLLVAGEMFDTQCGLKALRGDVAEEILPLLKDSGFAGDIELLYIALKYNLSIRRVPVRLERSSPTTVRVGADSLRILRRLLLLRSTWQRGEYFSRRLAQIARQEY